MLERIPVITELMGNQLMMHWTSSLKVERFVCFQREHPIFEIVDI
jgi:hypothetical protein